MAISGIISAIVVGLIVGALGRLVVPGANPMGVLLTILLGIAGAIVGGLIGVKITSSALIVFVLQVAVAALLVFLVSGMRRTRV